MALTRGTAAPSSPTRGEGSNRSEPDAVVVEGAAAGGGGLVGAGQGIDAAAILEGLVGPDQFGDQTPRRRPSKALACRVTVPRRCRGEPWRRRRCPSPRDHRDGRRRSGGPSRFRDDGVSLKVELRKVRAGLVARRNGEFRVRLLDAGPMIGQGRHIVDRAEGADARLEAHVLPVRLEAIFAVGMGEAIEEMRILEVAAARRSSSALPASRDRAGSKLSASIDDLAHAHRKAGMLGADSRARSPITS